MNGAPFLYYLAVRTVIHTVTTIKSRFGYSAWRCKKCRYPVGFGWDDAASVPKRAPLWHYDCL